MKRTYLILTISGRDYAVPFRSVTEAKAWHDTYVDGPFKTAMEISEETATEFMDDEVDAAAIDRHTEAGLDSDEE
jgi:hypothetical protein